MTEHLLDDGRHCAGQFVKLLVERAKELVDAMEAVQTWQTMRFATWNTRVQDRLSQSSSCGQAGSAVPDTRWCVTLTGSTMRITPPSDTRESDRRARPFVRPAFG
jgi:hypothetical protein